MYMSIKMSNELQQVDLGLSNECSKCNKALVTVAQFFRSGVLLYEVTPQSLRIWKNIKFPRSKRILTAHDLKSWTGAHIVPFLCADEEKRSFLYLKIGMFTFGPEVIHGQKRGQNLSAVKEDQAMFNFLQDEW